MFNFKTWFRGLMGEESTQHTDFAQPLIFTESGSDFRSLSGEHNDFALALFERLAQSRGNLFISPFSIRIACAMASAGARGETAAQMNSALHFPAAGATTQAEFVELVERFAAGGLEYEVSVANALWSQAGATLNPEFVALMSREYGGDVHNVDFCGGDIEAARAEINRWVEEKTNQRIHDLVPAGSIDANTRLALVNAVYFKGRWLEPFETTATRDDLFYPEEGAPARVPLMHRKAPMRYVQAPGFQAVELDYQGGELAMLVLLPEKNKLKDFEAKLSAKFLDQYLAESRYREVELFLPRFRMNWDMELASQLSALGMPLAFTPSSADFSGINGHKPPHNEALFISCVLHQAMVDVNEEGTEAAAASAVAVTWLGISAPEAVPVLRADHPFLFAIRDKKSGAILFLGRVARLPA